jgi:hypothetical protein
MDISKAKAAIVTAQGEVKKIIETIGAAVTKGDGSDINGLKSLANANAALTRASEKLDDAVKKTQPKEKKAKGEKKSK